MRGTLDGNDLPAQHWRRCLTRGVSDASELIDDVRVWLERGGYVLEMQVARIMRARNAMVEQGYRYTDPQTGQEREGDVTASIHRLEGSDHIHGYELLVECKATQSPWVVFLGRSDWANAWHPRQLFSLHCEECLDLAMNYNDFLREAPTGYAMTEKRVLKGKDHAYEALQQVTSSAISRFPETPAWQEEQHANVDDIKAIGVPVVVTESPLITCSLNADGTVDLRERDRVTVFVPRIGLPQGHGGDGIEVSVVRLSALETFMDALCRLVTGEESDDRNI
jgi:hypothetical protein